MAIGTPTRLRSNLLHTRNRLLNTFRTYVDSLISNTLPHTRKPRTFGCGLSNGNMRRNLDRFD